MLEGIFGNATAEKVLLYLEQFEEGYALGIARAFDDMPVSMVQRQLERLEAAAVLVSRLQGRTRVFTWNPRFVFESELRALLRRALKLLPASDRARYFDARRRPGRVGKLQRRPSVADELRVVQRDEVAKLKAGDRVRLALQLGDESIALFASARGLTARDACRMQEHKRHARRRPSGCMEALLG